MNLSSLKSLQKRIREATRPDREIDCEIANFHGWRQDADYNYTPSGAMTLEEPPRYTTYPEGLGACVALLHERFPGCEWVRMKNGEFAIWKPKPLNWLLLSSRASLANDCLTFIDAIIQAEISRLEAQEAVE